MAQSAKDLALLQKLLGKCYMLMRSCYVLMQPGLCTQVPRRLPGAEGAAGRRPRDGRQPRLHSAQVRRRCGRFGDLNIKAIRTGQWAQDLTRPLALGSGHMRTPVSGNCLGGAMGAVLR